MKGMWRLLPLLAAVVSAKAGAAQFRLHSETWTNLAEGGGASTLSLYRYDDQGNRILKETRPHPDTAGPTASSIQYAYDSLNRPVRVVTREGADTLAIVEYRYASGNLVAARTLDKSGTLRFVDSLRYDSRNRLAENFRVTGGVLLQTHRFTYDAQDRLLADTLWERQDSALVPAQAIVNAYDSAGLPASETHSRRVSGQWFAIKTVKKGYANRKLSFLATYERDGTNGVLMDSVAFSYDADGNRILEKGFDDEREPVYSIAFEWRRLGPGSIRSVERSNGRIRIAAGPEGLKFAAPGRGPLRLVLRDAQGLVLRRASLEVQRGTAEMAWPQGLAKGVYLAEMLQGGDRKAAPVLRP